MRFTFPLRIVVLVFGMGSLVLAQDQPDANSPAESSATKNASSSPGPSTVDRVNEATEQIKESGKKLTAQAEDEVSKIAKSIDQDPRAKDAAAGILQPIYQVAEALAFPAFHWLAFALMAAGVVSYALQLVLGKLVVLTRMGFSVKEIISDAVSLAISVFGLVLTTQAAAENSTFTKSPAAVISATIIGAVVGIILYRWGQAQELEAVTGRSVRPAPAKK